MMTWQDGDSTTVAVLDHDGGTVQAMIVEAGEVRRASGTVRRVA
jgi:hypothetical protein